MKKPQIYFASFFVILLLIFIGWRVTAALMHATNDRAPLIEKLAPCYHGTVGDSDSVFTVDSQYKKKISGSMSFVFAQKDSSYGTYQGTFSDGKMIVTYDFWSEGVESFGDYIFTKDGENFVGSGYVYKPANDCKKFLRVETAKTKVLSK